MFRGTSFFDKIILENEKSMKKKSLLRIKNIMLHIVKNKTIPAAATAATEVASDAGGAAEG